MQKDDIILLNISNKTQFNDPILIHQKYLSVIKITELHNNLFAVKIN